MNSLELSDKPAHDGTCDWIVANHPTETADQPQFMPWTRNDESLFWISGKAASGKSTLMKYIYHDDTVHAALEEWAHGRKLLKAGYFFIERAGDLAKCREGMLRSLLHQILKEQRHLIAVAFPSFFPVGKHPPRPTPETVNTWESLSTAFAATLEGLRDSKVCLFIDGLDEYRMMDQLAQYTPDQIELITEGSNDDAAWGTSEWIVDGHLQIAKFILQHRGRPNTKICFSSRLLNVFETRFRGLPGLQIHRYTAGAIKKYCTERLEEEACGMEDLQAFVAAVTNKSLGVFLWVRLVIDRLVTGNENGDKVSELWDVLEKIPQKLNGKDGLYMKMLENIRKEDRDEAAKLFQLVKKWDEVSLLGAPRMDIITLFLAEEGYLDAGENGGLRVKNDKFSPETWEALRHRWTRLQRRLRSRCGGLLEGTKEVQFMHLTAKEFLSQKRWWSHLFEPQQGFLSTEETKLALISGQIRRFKCCAEATMEYWGQQGLAEPAEQPEPITRIPPKFLCHMVASILQMLHGDTIGSAVDSNVYESLADELDATCDKLIRVSVFDHSKPSRPNWFELLFKEESNTQLLPKNMIELALACGMGWYVIQKLRRNTVISKAQSTESLGLLAVGNQIRCRGAPFGYSTDSSPKIMEVLLMGGMDPNLELQDPRLAGKGSGRSRNGMTVWTVMLWKLSYVRPSAERAFAVMELLLTHGADPAARVRTDSGRFITPAVAIRNYLRKFQGLDLTAYPKVVALLHDAKREG